jgi:hypothetical protein
MWGAERWRVRWAESRISAPGRARTLVWVAIVLLVSLFALVVSVPRLHARLRGQSPGSDVPSSSEPVPVPARGAPSGPKS